MSLNGDSADTPGDPMTPALPLATAAAVLLLAFVSTGPAHARWPDPVERRALEGDKDAQHDLCYTYLYGEQGRRQNHRKAYRWCSAAAAAGVSSALTLLAEMHYLGQHVDESPGMARQFYLIAAEQGHVHAQFMLGHMALTDPVSPDEREFCRWTRAAAEQGYDKAKEQLESVEAQWRKEKGSDVPSYCDSLQEKPLPTERRRAPRIKSPAGLAAAGTVGTPPAA
jgi:TPR repeat protein